MHPNTGFQLCFKCSKKPLEVFYKGGHDLIYVFKRPSAAVWGLNGRRRLIRKPLQQPTVGWTIPDSR